MTLHCLTRGAYDFFFDANTEMSSGRLVEVSKRSDGVLRRVATSFYVCSPGLSSASSQDFAFNCMSFCVAPGTLQSHGDERVFVSVFYYPVVQFRVGLVCIIPV